MRTSLATLAFLLAAAGCSGADTTTAESVAPTDDIASVADAFVAEVDAHQTAQALELVAADPSVSMFTARTRDDLEAMLGWIEATDWHFDNQGCQVTTENIVLCKGLQSNAWSDAVDGDPVDGSFTMAVEDGLLQTVSYQFNIPAWSELAFGPFFDFVRANHGDDVEKMWVITDRGIQGPQLNDGAFELFRIHSAAYAESIAPAPSRG